MAKKPKKTSDKKKTAREKKSLIPLSGRGSKKSTGMSSKKNVKTVASDISKPANRKTNKKAKTHLTAADLDHFKKLLTKKLYEILGDVDWIENEALRKSRQDATGDLSTMPIHMADLGTDNYEQEFSLGLMNSERKLVQEILDALKRIALGTYGICEATGKPISRARLEANPWARHCIEYASLIEQGKTVKNQSLQTVDFETQKQAIEKSLSDSDTDEDDIHSYDAEDSSEEEEEEKVNQTYAEGSYYEEDYDDEEDEKLF